MIRKFSFLLLLASTILFAGCIDVLEEMNLNADGTGTYMLRYDLSALLSDPTMREMIQTSMESEGGEQGLNGMENIDTIMFLYDNLGPDVENREFWKKVTIHMVMNSETKEYKIDFLLNFTSLNDVAYMFEQLPSITSESGSIGQFSSLMPTYPQFSQKKKTLVRKGSEADKEAEEIENMEMVEMFLSDAKYTCVYHLPGKVSSCKIPNSTINGNTVTVENSLLDALKGEAKLDGTIKFK